MAIVYTEQYNNAYVASPRVNLYPHEMNGRVRHIYGKITLGAEIDTTDVVKVCKLPANAVPVRIRFVAPGGTAGVLQLGWAAGERYESADADGFAAAVAGNAAVNLTQDLSSGVAGIMKRFAEPVDVELTATTLTAGWNGDVVQFSIEYIID